MDFSELVQKRYSVRNYDTRTVSRDKIDSCIEAARLAPSACNSQPWKFIVIDDSQLREKISDSAFKNIVDFNHFAYRAPVLVLIVSERQKISARLGGIIKRKNFSQMDIGISAEHFCLQAADLGLGTCMLGWFNENKVKRRLKIPANKRIELVIALGYSMDDSVPDKKRKPKDQMLSYNKY